MRSEKNKSMRLPIVHSKTIQNLQSKELFVALFLCLNFFVINTQIAPDLVGQYCERRSKHCCSGRQDECSAPILGTLCYCDDFCNRTRNDDCCPDYWTICKGLPPPPLTLIDPRCYENGRYYNSNETINSNCNQCKCQLMNGKMELLCENHVCLVDEALIDTINRDFRFFGWRAQSYPTFWGRKYQEGIDLRLGTIHLKKQVLSMEPVKNIIDVEKINKFFDARKKWPGISTPKDQGWCGASWAFSTAAVASDRFVVQTEGNYRAFLSPQNLLDCNSRNQRGCNGGHLTRAWTFIRKFGLVSEECYPWQGALTQCRVSRYKAPIDNVQCPFNRSRGRLHRVGPVYRIATELGIMNEIVNSGPVQATMKVHRDFFSYKSGIYRCTSISTSERHSFHSVRIIGWGEEYHDNKLIKYWIVSNSWGEWWGEGGFFRIQRGVNECSIEDFVIAIWAKIDDFNAIVDTGRLTFDDNSNKV